MTVPIPEAALHDLERRNVVARLWQRDHTLWKPDPTEIANRLGWLTVADEMQGRLPRARSLLPRGVRCRLPGRRPAGHGR